MNAVSDDLAKLSTSGNVQALTQQAVAAGSVMNKASPTNSTNSTNEAMEVFLISSTSIVFHLIAIKYN